MAAQIADRLRASIISASFAVSEVASKVGHPMGLMAIQGWITGSRDLPTKMNEKVREAIASSDGVLIFDIPLSTDAARHSETAADLRPERVTSRASLPERALQVGGIPDELDLDFAGQAT